MEYIILLTGCINPNGMHFTSLTDPTIRLKQYADAINFYIKNTDLPIVFADNSGTDMSLLGIQDNQRVELLSFSGNSNKTRGKGYGEAEILSYALTNSHLINYGNKNSNPTIIKITGRLIISNIHKTIEKKFLFQEPNSVVVSINSDFSFADSRIIIAPKSFFQEFLKHKEKLDDSKGNFFEHVLIQCIIQEKNSHYFPFFVEPQIIGQSGTSGERYKIQDQNLKYRIAYKMYAYGKICYFNKYLTNKKLKFHHHIIYYFLYIHYNLLHKIINKL